MSSDQLSGEVIQTLRCIIKESGNSFAGHSQKVGKLCVALSSRILGPEARTDLIYLVCLLHDLGMLNVPAAISQKPDTLNAAEMDLIREHPLRAERILANLSLFEEALPIIRHHHEAVDGSGYPDGLKGNQIPIESRIMRLAESYVAMTSPRPHRPAMTREEAIAQIRQDAGTVYDKLLIGPFIKHIAPETAPADNGKISTRDLLHELVEDIHKGEINLPVMPNIVQRVDEIVKTPESTALELAEVIEQEPTISLRLIAISNSALYGAEKRIEKIKDAVYRIGTKETQDIVTAIASRSLYQSGNKEISAKLEQLWQHSLATAYAARAIAQLLELPGADKYFLTGLVHDIGKTLLLQALTEVLKKQQRQLDLDEIMLNIQTIHADFGARLLQHWEFADDLVQLVRGHEAAEICAATPKPQLILNLANMLTRTIGYSLFADQKLKAEELAAGKLLNIAPGKLQFIARKVNHFMELSDGMSK